MGPKLETIEEEAKSSSSRFRDAEPAFHFRWFSFILIFMLDIKFIRENKDLIDLAAKKKLIKFDGSKLLLVDDKRRETLQSVESKRAEQNNTAGAVAIENDLNKRGPLIAESKLVIEELQKEE